MTPREEEGPPIQAANFIAGLLQQRANRTKGGIYQLTQTSMAYNSNRVEGGTLTAEQTRHLYDTQTLMGPVRIEDAIEVRNHFRAFDYMLEQVGKELTLDEVKTYHRLLKEGTGDARLPWFVVGDWKRVPNEVSGKPTTLPAAMDKEMRALLTKFAGPLIFNQVADFHCKFQKIYPFQDGNGRVGRLLTFKQVAENNILAFMILDQDKSSYYRGLEAYGEEPRFLQDTFRHSQDQYFERFKSFVSSRMRLPSSD